MRSLLKVHLCGRNPISVIFLVLIWFMVESLLWVNRAKVPGLKHTTSKPTWLLAAGNKTNYTYIPKCNGHKQWFNNMATVSENWSVTHLPPDVVPDTDLWPHYTFRWLKDWSFPRRWKAVSFLCFIIGNIPFSTICPCLNYQLGYVHFGFYNQHSGRKG